MEYGRDHSHRHWDHRYDPYEVDYRRHRERAGYFRDYY